MYEGGAGGGSKSPVGSLNGGVAGGSSGTVGTRGCVPWGRIDCGRGGTIGVRGGTIGTVGGTCAGGPVGALVVGPVVAPGPPGAGAAPAPLAISPDFGLYAKAYDLMTSPEARKAFHIQSEPEKLREEYGQTQIGQCALLGRRLVEAGCRFVGIDDYVIAAVCRAVRAGGQGGDVDLQAWLPDLARWLDRTLSDHPREGIHRVEDINSHGARQGSAARRRR